MKILFSKEKLHDGVSQMAQEIEHAFEGRQLTIVGVLTGSVVLLADLIRLLEQPMRVGVIQASSYRGATTERGDLVINSELMLDISGRDVLLVDDIFDTGQYIGYQVTAVKSLCVTPIRKLIIRRAIDIMKYRTRQPAACQFTEIPYFVTVFQAHDLFLFLGTLIGLYYS